MIITYFRLRGYINILQGMGLDELVIPFSEFRNRIILIQGENGTGKSTIINALTPNPDPSDCFRTDVLVDPKTGNRIVMEYPAEKEIHYYDPEDGSTYKILLQSIVDESMTRRTTRGYISKNDQEYNPTGNITSFKEMRDNLLGIDSIYLDLSSVSSENRGLVDMIPSERRKYLASYIGSLETYNNINKILSKKVNNCKAYINTLNSKIYEIGNEAELRAQQIKLEESLDACKKQRDQLLKDLSEAESTIKMLDPDNKMQDLCASISERLEALNREITQNQLNLVSLHNKLNDGDISADLDQELANIDEKIKGYTDLIAESKSNITEEMAALNATNKSIEADEARLNEITSSFAQDNVEKAVTNLKEEADIMKEYIKDKIEVYSVVTKDELLSLKSALESFKNNISVKDSFDESEYILAVKELISGKACYMMYTDIDTIKGALADEEKDLIRLKTDLDKYTDDLEKIKGFESKRPETCTNDKCPYIADLVELSKIYENFDISEIENEYKSEIESKEKLEQSLVTAQHVLAIAQNLEQGFNTIKSNSAVLSKIPKLAYLCSVDKLGEKLINHSNFHDFTIIDEYLEFASIYEDYKKIIDQLKDLESDYKIYKNNKKLIDSLSSSIKQNKSENEARTLKIRKLGQEVEFNDKIVQDLSKKRDIVVSIINENNKSIELAKGKEELRKEFDGIKDNIRKAKEAADSIERINDAITEKDNNIKPLEEEITRLKYNLTNIVQYRQELTAYSEAYDKFVFLRNACAPGNGNGIQSEYIKKYMNDIILNCNQILGLMFNGTIQIDVPVINEKQFSIPFIGPGGIMVPDISCGSTAQKCMIGLVFACVSMMKASTKYNIPRFDEIDGGLDQSNRIVFINAMNQVLDIMNSQQCIICSHNMEFDTQSTTRILCSHNGIRIEQ